MNRRLQSGQVWAAGAFGALCLAIELLLPAPLLDSAMQIAFAAASLVALRSSGILDGLTEFSDYGNPSLQALARIAPILVIVQLWMGTALHYGSLGPLPHVLGAMLVGAYLLYFATGVLEPAPAGHPTRIAALSVLFVIGLQVLFGVGAYVVRFAQSGPNLLPQTQLFSRLHVVTGTLLLGLTAVLAELVQRSSRRPEVQGSV